MVYWLVAKINQKTNENKRTLPVHAYIAGGIIILLLTAAGLVYFKYWNIATVNGAGISRLSYIKNLENQDGKQILDQMVQNSLIQQEGAKKGIKISQADIDMQLSSIEAKLKTQGATLDQALASQGMTKDQLVEQIKIQQTANKLVNPKIEITQAQIDDFLKTYKDQLPAGQSQSQLEDLARQQLTTQAKNQAVQEWIDGLLKNAKIIYK